MSLVKKLALSLFLVSTASVASIETLSDVERKHLTITEMTVREIPSTPYIINSDYYNELNAPSSTPAIEQANPIDQAGKVIKVARDLVALGEDIYRLVVKGKPSNTTVYAPISVIPKVNNEAVDLLETENWSMPVKRSYAASWKNAYGVEVVYFRYSVLFSYNGSYDGRGKYLTSVQVIPEQVTTLWGYDFTATMKLGGIQNNGTRLNPIAGATVLIEYTVSTILKAENKVDTFFVAGNGSYKKY